MMNILPDAGYFVNLIAGVIAFLLMISGCSTQPDEEYYLYVGTYTGESSEGIYVMKFNASDGSISPVDTVSGVENPSYLALSPDNEFLYAVNENADSAEAYLSSFAIDQSNGSLSFLNRQTSGGGAPCYVDTDGEGQSVFAGNYLGGSLSMFSVGNNGSLSEPESVIKHEGSSINTQRQESPHVHCTLISPDNAMLFVADLGTDQVKGYGYNAANNRLDTEAAFVYETEPGAGPRHLTFHPNGEYLYLVNELNGSVDVLEYKDRSLTHLQTMSTLPENYNGAVSGADIHVSPDGNHLYVSNREDLNNIVIYSIEPESGELTNIGEVASGGVHPRNFVIDPTGRYLLAANRHTDNIVVFERNPETGMIQPNGEEISVSQPVCLKLMAAQ